MTATRRAAMSAIVLAGAAATASAAETTPAVGKLETGTLATALVPSPVKYTTLAPPGVAIAGLPLLLLLHGGDGDNGFLANFRPAIEAAWAAGEFAPCLVATPDADRSFYLDYQDGSQKWETFITTELIQHLRSAYGLASGPAKTVVSGISMGGLGSLRLALKHPDLFGGVASLEAGIEPALRWADVKPRNSFERGPAIIAARYGSPVDEAFWQANNPANIAIARRDAIVAAGLQIYIEVGDADMFHLDEGVEFMHRVLWDHDIRHEYRLVHGADHLGRTLPGRLRDGLRFLQAHVLNPPPPDTSYAAGKLAVQAMKRAAGVDDSGPRPPLLPTR
ncbi:MAG TPA: alpha/beta hydrolase-fold protein [Caulobacteraceae bacterium]|jgi:S-formylglutathione hydrolase